MCGNLGGSNPSYDGKISGQLRAAPTAGPHHITREMPKTFMFKGRVGGIRPPTKLLSLPPISPQTPSLPLSPPLPTSSNNPLFPTCSNEGPHFYLQIRSTGPFPLAGARNKEYPKRPRSSQDHIMRCVSENSRRPWLFLGCFRGSQGRFLGGSRGIFQEISGKFGKLSRVAKCSSKTKGPGEQVAARYFPKILLLKRAQMALCPFHRSHGDFCARNRPVSETKFLDDFWGPLSLPDPLFYC